MKYKKEMKLKGVEVKYKRFVLHGVSAEGTRRSQAGTKGCQLVFVIVVVIGARKAPRFLVCTTNCSIVISAQ